MERLQFEWAPADGVPAATGSLRFAEASDEEFLTVFRRIAEGSLDAHTRAGVAARGVEATAREEMDFYLGAPGNRGSGGGSPARPRARWRAWRFRRRRRTA
ncbi:hypothetical protein GCM10020220_067410 [Nonomuraea rubra]